MARHCVVLGAGGIGSNIRRAWQTAFTGLVVTIDDDTVEASNLNRSDFTIADIGQRKADKCYRISSREEFFEKAGDFLREIIQSEGGAIGELTPDSTYNEDSFNWLRNHEYVTVVDCRDTIDPKTIFKEIDFKLTYNGAFGVRFEVNPFHSNDSVFGSELEAVRYGTTPSFCIPPMWLARTLVKYYKENREFMKNKNNHKIYAYNLEDEITRHLKEIPNG